jgi:hypothetical protein
MRPLLGNGMDARARGGVITCLGATAAVRRPRPSERSEVRWRVLVGDVWRHGNRRQRPVGGAPPASSLAVAWSPDGRWLSFCSGWTGRQEIWIMRAAGSPQQPIFPAALTVSRWAALLAATGPCPRPGNHQILGVHDPQDLGSGSASYSTLDRTLSTFCSSLPVTLSTSVPKASNTCLGVKLQWP